MRKINNVKFIDTAEVHIYAIGGVKIRMLSMPDYNFNTAWPFASTPHTFVVGKVDFTMVTVRGGTFLMGNQVDDESAPNYDWVAKDNEAPVHWVTLSDYMIGETLVTQKLWRTVMGKNPSWSDYNSRNPVESVSWDEICSDDGFLARLNSLLAPQLGGRKFVLPTEAQWEYAAAGGSVGCNLSGTQRHRYAGSDDIYDVAWFTENSNELIHPVKRKMPNELGLYDMSGNVKEWCSDWYADYTDDDQTNPTGPDSGEFRVVRNSNYVGCMVSSRVSYRHYAHPDLGYGDIGFRLALDCP